MKLDLVQTLSRASFLFFIVCLSVYFIFGVGAEKKIEGFVQLRQQPTDLNYNKDALAKTIVELFAEIYPNDVHYNPPSQQTIDFYVEYASVRKISRADLREIIEGSAPSLVNSLNYRNPAIPSKEIFGFEDEVAQVYNDILFRNPDEVEMSTYAKMLKTDKSFSIEKLKQILMASPEYKRLEKTQSNMFRAELIGGVTERQVNMMVVKAYKSVAGNEEIDPDTEKFLTRKFLEFNLDENKLKDFIKKYVKNESYYVEKAPKPAKALPLVKTGKEAQSQMTSLPAPPAKMTQILQTAQTTQEAIVQHFLPALTSTSKVFVPVVQEEAPQIVTQEKPIETTQTAQTAPQFPAIKLPAQIANIVTQEDLINMKLWMLNHQASKTAQTAQDNQGYVTQNNEYQPLQTPNKQMIEMLLRTVASDSTNTSGNYLDSQNVLDLIKQQGKTVFDKTTPDGRPRNPTFNMISNENRYDALGRDSAYAALVNNRNVDELKNTCERNRKYLNADDNMVLDPSQRWSVPQKRPPVCLNGKNTYQPLMEQSALLGTLLEDSKMTQVGSILPYTPPI